MRSFVRYAALIVTLAASAAFPQSKPSQLLNLQTQTQQPLPVAQSPLNPYAGGWVSGTSYGQGVTVFYAGQVWQSQIAANQGNTPSSSSSAWKAITPTLSGAAAGTTAGAAQTTDGNGNFIADPQTKIVNGTLQTLIAIAKGPRINPTHTDFAGGISESNTDVQNCAANRAALTYADTLAAQGEMATIQFPKGTYKSSCGWGRLGVNGDAHHMINLVGDAQNGTRLVNTSPTGNGLTINHPTSSVAYQQAVIANITFAGQDTATTGTLIENSGGANITYQNVSLQDNAGRGWALLNGAERNYCIQCTTSEVRWPITLSGDINETFFSELQMLDSGGVAQNGLPNNFYSYNRNSVNGVYPTSGTLYPDHHAAFVCEGNENVVVGIGGSTKSTHHLGGFKFDGCTLVSVNGNYIESASNNTLTHDVQLGGQKEPSVTTAAMTTTSLVVPVTNVMWQPHYLTSGADADAETQSHALTAQYLLMPPDHIAGSTAPSSLGGGITKGMIEEVQLGAFAGDGQAHFIQRGLTGNLPTSAETPAAPQAWPAGTLVTGVPEQMTSPLNLNAVHMNTMNPVDSSHTSGCSDAYNGPGAANNTCGSIILGYLTDGYTVSSSTINSTPTTSLNINTPAFYAGSDLTYAGGVVKVVSASHLMMTATPQQIRSYNGFGASAVFPAAGVNSALNTFNYGGVSVHSVYFSDSGLTAHVAFREPNSGTWMDSFNGVFFAPFHAGLDSNGEMPGFAWAKGLLSRDIGPNGFPTFEEETLGYPYSQVGKKWCVWYGATGGATPTAGTKSCPISMLMDTGTGAVTVQGISGGATFPAASASGQALVSTGAGTTYGPIALAPSATTDTTSANNITSGTLGSSVIVPASTLGGLPVSATSLATNSSGKIIAGSAAAVVFGSGAPTGTYASATMYDDVTNRVLYTCPATAACTQFTFTSSTAGSVVGYVAGSTVTTDAATVAIPITYRNSYIALTSPTAFTLAAGSDGQEITLTWKQGTATAYLVTPPSNVKGFIPPGPTLGGYNSQHFTYQLGPAVWVADSPGVQNAN